MGTALWGRAGAVELEERSEAPTQRWSSIQPKSGITRSSSSLGSTNVEAFHAAASAGIRRRTEGRSASGKISFRNSLASGSLENERTGRQSIGSAVAPSTSLEATLEEALGAPSSATSSFHTMNSRTTQTAFAFVDGTSFQGLVCFVLLVNTWALALETDNTSWPCWRLVNGLFLSLYAAELALRFFHLGGFTAAILLGRRWWLAYDLLTVGLGVLDFTASCIAAEPPRPPAQFGVADAIELSILGYDGTDHSRTVRVRRLLNLQLGRGSFILRCLMLTRLLRVVRIMRMHGPLYGCVKLLLGMLHTFAWILSIMFALCFVLAIVLTSLVGHGFLAHTDDEEISEEVVELFKSIPASLFTLFQLTTADDWSRISTPVVVASPLCRFFFVCHITFMSWTMLSLLTAVASETMISASSNRKEQEATDQEIQRHSFTAFLCAEFVRADTDGNHVLDKDEFTALMQQPSMVQQMKAHGIHLQESDLVRTWDTFDIDESGELTIDELVLGFSYLQENLAMKHVANVCYTLKHFGVKTDSNMDGLQESADELASQQEKVTDGLLQDCRRQQDRWALFLKQLQQDKLDDLDEEQTGSGLSSEVPADRHYSPLGATRSAGRLVRMVSRSSLLVPS